MIIIKRKKYKEINRVTRITECLRHEKQLLIVQTLLYQSIIILYTKSNKTMIVHFINNMFMG